MATKCEVCGKGTTFGRNIRYAHSGKWERRAPRTNRIFKANVHTKKMVVEGKTGADGSWRLAPTDPVGVGKHKLRLDRLTKDGKPAARLELPFDRVQVPPGTAEGGRLVVVHGDNLWNIARAHYGTGFQHILIYGANKEQIRDPDLIYPGQVLSMPKAN